MIQRAFPVLKLEYDEYWNGVEHSTPIGLATCFDSGDLGAIPRNSRAAAELTYDWMPIFGGHVRQCVPLIINCALVRYAEVIAQMANELGTHLRSLEVSCRGSEAIRTDQGVLLGRRTWGLP